MRRKASVPVVESLALPDLRFGFAPLPEPAAGYDPEGDARALVLPGSPFGAGRPIPGRTIRLAAAAERSVVRIPDAWNGKLAVCGTPATRSEHANDAIFGDFLMERGYAFASGNKGIPSNARLDGPASPDSRAYPIPFPLGSAEAGTLSMRFGALEPQPVPVAAWHESFAKLVRTAADVVREIGGRAPERTYALGLSIGGGQVRWLLERHPELADGGVEWAAVHWNVEHAFVRYLPAFLRAMPAYVASDYRDRELHDAVVDAGFPPDRIQDGALTSLWDAHYSTLPPYYADLTTFLFAGVLDPAAPPLETLASRAAYVPTATAERAIAAVAQTGELERPLVAIAGDADVFITPQRNFDPYLAALRAAGRAERYWPFEVADGTHVDGFAAYGWGLRAQLPFARRAFELLEDVVERGARPGGAGHKRRVASPEEM